MGELRQSVRRKYTVGSSPITCIAASQYSSRLVAVGNSSGYIRLIDLKYGDDYDLFDIEDEKELPENPESLDHKTLLRARLFPSRVEKVSFVSINFLSRLFSIPVATSCLPLVIVAKHLS